jgi:hypothetical protein
MIPAKEFEGELWIKASDYHRAIKTTQRPWVGLTNEERDRFVYIDAKDKKRFRKYGAEIEQILKEKNAQE